MASCATRIDALNSVNVGTLKNDVVSYKNGLFQSSVDRNAASTAGRLLPTNDGPRAMRHGITQRLSRPGEGEDRSAHHRRAHRFCRQRAG
jgi:hypothetical protein